MSSVNTRSSAKKKFIPLFADSKFYEYESSPPTSPARPSAARTRVRKGPAPKRFYDSDGAQIVEGVAAPTISMAAGLATAPPTGASENDANFSAIPPRPNGFVEPFPLSWNSGFHVVTAGTRVGITAHWAVAHEAIRCEHPSHKKFATFALAVEYYGVCHDAGVVQIRPSRVQSRPSPASPGQSPQRKKQRKKQEQHKPQEQRKLQGQRLFAVCSVPPPRQPIFSPTNQASASAGTVSRPISVASRPSIAGNSLSPSPIIRRSRPIIICSDSENDESQGYSAARPLPPVPDSTTFPVPTTVDPRVAFDAADSGDDATSVDADDEEESHEKDPSTTDASGALDVKSNDDDDNSVVVIISDNSDDDGAITISDDDDVISISSGDLRSEEETPHVTANPATPATANAPSSSLIVENGSGDELSSRIVDDGSDSDWGFPPIEDQDLMDAIGRVLDDPFGWGAGDGLD